MEERSFSTVIFELLSLFLLSREERQTSKVNSYRRSRGCMQFGRNNRRLTVPCPSALSLASAPKLASDGHIHGQATRDGQRQ
jgi:hypothetical protein